MSDTQPQQEGPTRAQKRFQQLGRLAISTKTSNTKSTGINVEQKLSVADLVQIMLQKNKENEEYVADKDTSSQNKAISDDTTPMAENDSPAGNQEGPKMAKLLKRVASQNQDKPPRNEKTEIQDSKTEDSGNEENKRIMDDVQANPRVSQMLKRVISSRNHQKKVDPSTNGAVSENTKDMVDTNNKVNREGNGQKAETQSEKAVNSTDQKPQSGNEKPAAQAEDGAPETKPDKGKSRSCSGMCIIA